MSKYEGGHYPALLNRFFDDDFFSRFAETSMPAINVKETKSAFKLEVSVPGFDKEDVNVGVDKNILTISAKKESSHKEKGDDEKILREEFTSSSFYRSFTLPEHVDTEKIEAKKEKRSLDDQTPETE